MELKIPENFFVGAAMSGPQTEGAYKTGGRLESIWDTWSDLSISDFYNKVGSYVGNNFYEKYEDHPELLPPEDGVISQKTEDLVGPYELHDFYLYQVLRFGFGPAKIFRLAKAAFAGRPEYPDNVLYKWLRNFYWRFFAQQFKRSCLPDGPKVGSVTLSPRGDWRMPSDASAALWLAELEQLSIKD